MKICPKCDVPHEKPGTYCSRTCANSHTRTEESKQKTAASMQKVIRRPRTKKQIEKWRESIIATKAQKKQERALLCDTLPFNELSDREQRNRILQEQNRKCAHCGISQEWNGKELRFELDHIDGNRSNHIRNNLEFLCPNCHSQTPTYRGKNIDKNKSEVSDELLLRCLKESPNIRQGLMKAGISAKGNNYKRAKNLLNI